MRFFKRAGLIKVSAFFMFLNLIACAGPKPVEDMVLAKAALDAAKEVGATSSASGYWYRAEENFRKGKKALRDHYNYDAKEYFVKAREYAEKAENSTRLKKFKSGEGYP